MTGLKIDGECSNDPKSSSRIEVCRIIRKSLNTFFFWLVKLFVAKLVLVLLE